MKLILVCVALACVLGGCGFTGTWSGEKIANASQRDLWNHWASARFDFDHKEAEKARQELLSREPTGSWDPEVAKLVREKKIRQGMTERQAMLAWGPPISRDVVHSPYGEQVTYTYARDRLVFFHDGELSWWHTED